MNEATFVFSTGRCGTQWLAKNLSEQYADLAGVTHEPHKREYLSRRLVGISDPKQWPSIALIERHIASIEERLEVGHYIECGWPCYGPLPYFVQRLAGRVRVIHLIRHPIPTAISMMTHLYYLDRRDRLAKKALLTPTDPGVAMPEYCERWPTMSRFEKCLYFWAEISLLGLRLERQLGIPWLRVRSEDMFRGRALKDMLDFLGLPGRDGIDEARRRRIDQFSQGTSINLRSELGKIRDHPRIAAVARELGYDPFDFDIEKLCNRYHYPSSPSAPRAKFWLPNWVGAGRNAQCPCGSGSRFKYCHGTLT